MIFVTVSIRGHDFNLSFTSPSPQIRQQPCNPSFHVNFHRLFQSILQYWVFTSASPYLDFGNDLVGCQTLMVQVPNGRIPSHYSPTPKTADPKSTKYRRIRFVDPPRQRA